MSQSKFVILVISDDGNCSKRKHLEDKLSKVVESSSYAVAEYYDQSSEEAISENVVIVVVAKNLRDEGVVRKIRDYFLRGGNVLTFEGLSVDDSDSRLEEISNLARISRGRSGGCWITSLIDSQEITSVDLSSMLSAIRHPKLSLRQLSKAWHCSNPPDSEKFTKANLFGTTAETESFKTNLSRFCVNHQLKLEKITLDFSEDNEIICPEDDLREFVQVTVSSPMAFDWTQYSSILKTRSLGRPIIHAKSTRSTMSFFDSVKFFQHGLVIIADKQVNGKGRGGNTWLSPSGCAMFSLHVQSSSTLYVSMLQHLAALAVVNSIRTRPGYESLDIRLKWPNDIYFGKSIKLGGVLVSCSFFKGKVMANIGLGVNLDNDFPTTSINQIVAKHSKVLTPITREDLLASTFNQLEDLMDLMTQKNGFTEIEKLYYSYWLHDNQKIRLKSEELPEGEVIGIVKGIDDSGYLLVQVETSGKVVSVVPGDNSFDMMQGLIIPKSQK